MRRHRLQAAQIFSGLVILVSSEQENAAFINAQRQSGQGPDSLLLAESKLKARKACVDGHL